MCEKLAASENDMQNLYLHPHTKSISKKSNKNRPNAYRSGY